MTDGVRMPRSYAFRTTTFDREYLSLELLKRIEVVRGPASALYGSDGMAGLVNFITHEPADFLVIQEVTAAWAAELEAPTAYPHRHVVPREDPYGLALLSRWPMESVTLVDLAGDGLPSLAGIVGVGGPRVRFVGLHTHWPLTPALAAARDEALEGAAQLASAADLPIVLAEMRDNAGAQGRVTMTPEMLNIQWEKMLLYPAGHWSRSRWPTAWRARSTPSTWSR